MDPRRVSQLPGPLSPRYRGRVPKLSASYRGHGVHHEPGPHTADVHGILSVGMRRTALRRRSTPGKCAFCQVSRGGAGGNRTPVHQAVTDPATTIPDFAADASLTGGSADRHEWRSTDRLSELSAVFPAVSGLSRRHPSLLLPGCGGSAPCGIAAHDVSRTHLKIRRRERTARWQFLLVAPFSESEQLGSHARPAKLTSKPVSPVDVVARPGYRTSASAPSTMSSRWTPSLRLDRAKGDPLRCRPRSSCTRERAGRQGNGQFAMSERAVAV